MKLFIICMICLIIGTMIGILLCSMLTLSGRENRCMECDLYREKYNKGV